MDPEKAEDMSAQINDPVLSDADIEAYLKNIQGPASRSNNDDGVLFYTKQAEKYPQLENSDQIKLIMAYQESLRLKKNLELNGNTLPSDVTRKARIQIRKGEQALEYLTLSNFRMCRAIVMEIIKTRYQYLSYSRSMDLQQELISEANIALVKAIQDFDPKKLPKFHAYAFKCIRFHLYDAVLKINPHGTPASWDRVYRIAQGEINEYSSANGHNPSMSILQELVKQRCFKYGLENLSKAEQALAPEEQKEAVEYRLKKSRNAWCYF